MTFFSLSLGGAEREGLRGVVDKQWSRVRTHPGHTSASDQSSPLSASLSVSVSVPLAHTIMSEYLWKKQDVEMECARQLEKKTRVLVLYTGGTIGMKWTDKGVISSNVIY